MTATGQVAAFTGVRKPFALREFPVPAPAAGAVLVKVRMANVCGSDLHIWRGEYDVSRGHTEPFCLSIGHEMAGEVAELGEGVTHDSAGQPLAVGDRIVYQYFCPCGRCRSCLRRSTPRCSEALRNRYPPDEYPHFNAAYGQYYYLNPGQAVFKVPANVSDDLAGPANCALAQVIEAFRRGHVGLGDHVVIQGAGGLGINAVAVAREMGVAQILIIDGIESRLELAHAFGADETMLLADYPHPDDRVRRVRELTDGWGADAVLEVSGLPAVVPEGLDMLAQGGTYLEVGNINQGKRVEIDPSVLVHGGKSLLGIMWYDPDCLKAALDLLSTKADVYPFEQILSHHYPLKDIDQAFADQDSGNVQRAALLPWAD
ncbi:5-exo-hydroxycamphor dehydrogenase [Symmachiella macrocystis]|uniref:5-exo-hydroxycamphor dehydrogenase n=1 Tax=Symmachiella macrocystis TaxID=2527985 RepID=A0A5C6B5G9_9PLAN|nr:zinc-binding dehydrogenase [Symmachiella macrocystis]TWU07188.1 5-exo-hydroxycamphor dehydrogenase [Symmachiella macrocystis]